MVNNRSQNSYSGALQESLAGARGRFNSVADAALGPVRSVTVINQPKRPDGQPENQKSGQRQRAKYSFDLAAECTQHKHLHLLNYIFAPDGLQFNDGRGG